MPTLQFSPDGRSLILFVDIEVGNKQTWRIRYPAGQGAQRFLTELHTYGGTPQMSWFPGGRTGVLAWTDQEGHGAHLWLAGFRSGVGRQITFSNSVGEAGPAISPDGKKILFTQSGYDYKILSASLKDASVETVISSGVRTGMPAWASHRERFVYVSNRNG
jgi:Tol biopolymer transport system component